tara:strand:+ start:1092 stop:1304 length:213 start_codon:yes stop_codon:yes gene_type:complete
MATETCFSEVNHLVSFKAAAYALQALFRTLKREWMLYILPLYLLSPSPGQAYQTKIHTKAESLVCRQKYA